MHEDWKCIHMAMVVKDMDEAIKRFEKIGVGPFPPFLGGPEGMPVTGKTVWGEPSDYDMDLRVAKSQFGGIGFELIQPLKGPSIYDEFLEKTGGGYHHLAYAVGDLDAAIAEMAKAGFKVVQTGAFERGKWAYVSTDEPGSIVVELCG
ncbi:VOC family protein [Chloroflexota bacterium]